MKWVKCIISSLDDHDEIRFPLRNIGEFIPGEGYPVEILIIDTPSPLARIEEKLDALISR